jgi:hypothetical protein
MWPSVAQLALAMIVLPLPVGATSMMRRLPAARSRLKSATALIWYGRGSGALMRPPIAIVDAADRRPCHCGSSP